MRRLVVVSCFFLRWGNCFTSNPIINQTDRAQKGVELVGSFVVSRSENFQHFVISLVLVRLCVRSWWTSFDQVHCQNILWKISKSDFLAGTYRKKPSAKEKCSGPKSGRIACQARKVSPGLLCRGVAKWCCEWKRRKKCIIEKAVSKVHPSSPSLRCWLASFSNLLGHWKRGKTKIGSSDKEKCAVWDYCCEINESSAPQKSRVDSME